jgi:hypothetical protein
MTSYLRWSYLAILVGCWGRKMNCLIVLTLVLISSRLGVLMVLLLLLRKLPLVLVLTLMLVTLLELLGVGCLSSGDDYYSWPEIH